MEYFISDKNVVDFSLWVEWFNVVTHPPASILHVDEVRDFSVGNSDGDKDSCARKCPENIWVHVEELDSVDGGFILEELCNLSRRREVVSEGAVINSDRIHCGEVLNKNSTYKKKDRE